jgi:hypothetical protein
LQRNVRSGKPLAASSQQTDGHKTLVQIFTIKSVTICTSTYSYSR